MGDLNYQIFKLQRATGKDFFVDPAEIDPPKRYRFVFR